jgi:hypothetical protein
MMSAMDTTKFKKTFTQKVGKTCQINWLITENIPRDK